LEEEAETRERHCRHYLTQLQQREAALHSAHQREMLDQVTAEARVRGETLDETLQAILG